MECWTELGAYLKVKTGLQSNTPYIIQPSNMVRNKSNKRIWLDLDFFERQTSSKEEPTSYWRKSRSLSLEREHTDQVVKYYGRSYLHLSEWVNEESLFFANLLWRSDQQRKEGTLHGEGGDWIKQSLLLREQWPGTTEVGPENIAMNKERKKQMIYI